MQLLNYSPRFVAHVFRSHARKDAVQGPRPAGLKLLKVWASLDERYRNCRVNFGTCPSSRQLVARQDERSYSIEAFPIRPRVSFSRLLSRAPWIMSERPILQPGERFERADLQTAVGAVSRLNRISFGRVGDTQLPFRRPTSAAYRSSSDEMNVMSRIIRAIHACVAFPVRSLQAYRSREEQPIGLYHETNCEILQTQPGRKKYT